MTRILSLCVLCALMLPLALTSGVRAGRDHPDIIVVVLDDARTSDWQALPQTQDLLHDGTWLPNFILTTALCCPSRASMLSGRYAHNHGVYDNGSKGRPGGWPAFRDNESRALPTQLPDYDTALVGKYLNEYAGKAPPPGWDTFFATHSGKPSYHLADGYSTDVERDHAVAFLGDGDPDPKFLWFAPFAPHEPATYAPRHTDAFPEASGLDRDRLRSLLAVDEAVVALNDALGERAGSAVWIVVSDNGYLIDEGGFTGKNVPRDPVHRVTALARIPGLPAGTDDRIVANVDLFATVITAAGYPVPDNDGRAWQDGWQRDGILIEGWGRQGKHRTHYAGIWTPPVIYLERSRHAPEFRATDAAGTATAAAEATDWAAWLDRLQTCKGADCG